MLLSVFGVNYQDTPVDIRESLALSETDLLPALSNLHATNWVKEVYILSTCNRTEFYLISSQDIEANLLDWLAQYFKIQPQNITNYLYKYKDIYALEHLLSVASGLNSMVQGETQILGQIKRAYTVATQHGYISKYLHLVMQKAINVAKEIRHTTDININATSLPYVAMKLAKRTFTDIENTQIMLIGAGETNQLMASYLDVIGVQNIIIANRSLAAAQDIADGKQATAICLEDIPNHLYDTDIIIAATSSGKILLDKSTLEKHLHPSKKHILLIDLSMPRNLDTEINKIHNAKLYNMDDLQTLMNEVINLKTQSVNHAQRLVSNSAIQIKSSLNEIDANAAISTYKKYTKRITNNLLQSAKKQLDDCNAQEVLETLAHQLTSKLSHDIYELLKQAAKIGNKDFMQLIDNLISKHSLQIDE